MNIYFKIKKKIIIKVVNNLKIKIHIMTQKNKILIINTMMIK